MGKQFKKELKHYAFPLNVNQHQNFPAIAAKSGLILSTFDLSCPNKNKIQHLAAAAAAAACFLHSFLEPKKGHNRWCFPCFFMSLEAQNHGIYDVFSSW